MQSRWTAAERRLVPTVAAPALTPVAPDSCVRSATPGPAAPGPALRAVPVALRVALGAVPVTACVALVALATVLATILLAATPAHALPGTLYCQKPGDGAATELLRYGHEGHNAGAPAWAAGGSAASLGVPPGTPADGLGWPTATSDGVLYAVDDQGRLLWFRDTGLRDARSARFDPAGPAWARGSGNPIAEGWGAYHHVFAGPRGVVYAVDGDGRLHWNRHLGYRSGNPTWAAEGPVPLGTGWSDFVRVFAGDNGTIYSVDDVGTLRWHRHLGWLDGRDAWAPKHGTRLGDGWNRYVSVFGASHGLIYALAPDGRLYWHRHDGQLDGTLDWAGRGGLQVGANWSCDVAFAGFESSAALPASLIDGYAMADVDGDGRADFCRLVETPDDPDRRDYLACDLSTPEGFASQHDGDPEGFRQGHTSAEAGHDGFLRSLVDVDGDGRADLCRSTGGQDAPQLGCERAAATAFASNLRAGPRGLLSAPYEAPLPPEGLEAFADVDGDGLADYCRSVGTMHGGSAEALTCLRSGTADFGGQGDTSRGAGVFRSDGGQAAPDFASGGASYDLGYQDFRAFGDVNGDGRDDFCRIVGDPPHRWLACDLATAGGFASAFVRENDPYPFRSAEQDLDVGGDGQALRSLRDVNGDGFGDFCRVIGKANQRSFACDLGGAAGFASTRGGDGAGYRTQHVRYDVGPDSGWRGLGDVDGDGRLDFCRIVGNRPRQQLACDLGADGAFASRVGGDLVGRRTALSGDGVGLDGTPRWLVDVDGDGRDDFCRIVGSEQQPALACDLSGPDGFASATGASRLARSEPPATRAFLCPEGQRAFGRDCFACQPQPSDGELLFTEDPGADARCGAGYCFGGPADVGTWLELDLDAASPAELCTVHRLHFPGSRDPSGAIGAECYLPASPLGPTDDMTCADGAWFDFADGGSCWSCGDAGRRTTLPVDSSGACLRPCVLFSTVEGTRPGRRTGAAVASETP